MAGRTCDLIYNKWLNRFGVEAKRQWQQFDAVRYVAIL